MTSNLALLGEDSKETFIKYIQFDYQTRKEGLKEPVIRLYPIVCMHVGAEQCDEKFIKEYIKRCLNDPNGRMIYMGDGGECVTKLSKGDIYKQLLSPQQQSDVIVEWLKPVAEQGKLLFGIRGNHGNRVYKETGLSFDANLCYRLNIPYLGVSTFVNLIVNRSSYDLYFHHGADSGTSLAAKISKHEKFAEFIDADAIFTAHSHITADLQPTALLSCDNTTGRVHTKLRHGYICGSGYDSRSGYAEERAYRPILPSYLVVEFDGRIIEGKAQYNQHAEIIRSDGQHPLKHEYIFRED